MKIKTKKIINKITAIAGTALMTMSGVFAAVNLGSLTDTFITAGNFNAYVVVGSGSWNTAITWNNPAGLAKDLAGAVEVAAAFAQQAYSSGAATGTAIFERNVSPGALNSTGLTDAMGIKTWNTPAQFDAATEGFSWLVNQTIVDSAGEDIAKATGMLIVKNGMAYLADNRSLRISTGNIVYNISFDLPVDASATNVPMPDGINYQILEIQNGTTNTNVSLGALSSFDTGLNTVNEIGSSGVTVQLTRATLENQVNMIIKDPAGNILNEKLWTESTGAYEAEDFGVTIQLNELRVYTDGSVEAEIGWTTSTLRLEEGKVNDQYPNWTIKIGEVPGAANVTWIAFENKIPGSFTYMDQGEEISMFDGLFSVYYKGLEIDSDDKQEFNLFAMSLDDSASELTYEDENYTTHTIDFEKLTIDLSGGVGTDPVILDGSAFQITCDATGGINITNLGTGTLISNITPTGTNVWLNSSVNLSYTVLVDFSWNDCDGIFNMSVLNFTSNAGKVMGSNITWGAYGSFNGSDGILTVKEVGSDVITVSYVGGGIDQIVVDGASAIDDTGDFVYSRYGTLLTRTDDSQVSILYPDARRLGYASVGREEAAEYIIEVGVYDPDLDLTLKSAAGESVTINKIAVGMSKLDTEITTSSLNRPVILLGGPAVNKLVKDLVDAGKSQAASAYAADRALVQVIDSAFNGQAALLIAGYTGDDTRMAAQVVASEILGSDVLSGGFTGTSVTLNTGVTSYSSVTVV